MRVILKGKKGNAKDATHAQRTQSVNFINSFSANFAVPCLPAGRFASFASPFSSVKPGIALFSALYATIFCPAVQDSVCQVEDAQILRPVFGAILQSLLFIEIFCMGRKKQEDLIQ